MDTTAAAQQAKVTVATIRTWCRIGAVAAIKRAGRWVVEAGSLAYRISLSVRRTVRQVLDRTSEFVDELAMQIDGAAAAYSMTGLRALLERARRRDTQHIAGIPADQVHLTDAQWAAVARSISFEIGCLKAEH